MNRTRQLRNAIFEPDLESTFTNHHPSLDLGLTLPRQRGADYLSFFRLQNVTAVPPLFF